MRLIEKLKKWLFEDRMPPPPVKPLGLRPELHPEPLTDPIRCFEWAEKHSIAYPLKMENGKIKKLVKDELIVEFDGVTRAILVKENYFEVLDWGHYNCILWCFDDKDVVFGKNSLKIRDKKFTFSTLTDVWKHEGRIFCEMKGSPVSIRVYEEKIS